MNKPRLSNIANGVTFCSVKTDMFKTGKICFTMALPLSGNTAANAILPYILRRSCRKYPDFTSLNSHLDELYGAIIGARVEKLGEAQVLTVEIGSIDDRFALSDESVLHDSAELLFDLIFEPKLTDGTFDESDVETEKRLLAERLVSENDDKRTYALNRCYELMCGNEPFGKNKYGTEDEINALTAADVYNAWRNMLCTAVIRVICIGSSDSDEIENSLISKFTSIDRAPCDITTEFVGNRAETSYYSETQPVKQGKLVMGYRVGMNKRDDYFPAMTVMSDIFGGGTYSKLFSNVREKMSLCYYCSARLNKNKGILMVQSGIETENEEKAKAAITDQLDEMKKGNFSDEDFKSSLLSIGESLKGYNDSPHMLCAWYALQILDKELKTPEEYTDELKAVQRDDVVRAANLMTLDTVFMLIGTEGAADEN